MPVLGQRIWTTASAGTTPTAPVYPVPTDPTADIPTTGASGSYSEATVTTVTSSLDLSITDLKYARCHDTGHVGAGKLVPVLLFAGFHRSAVTDFPQAFRRRFASYVDPTSGRAPCVVAVDSRGRSAVSGQLDYVRDRQDRLDCLDHAISVVGASNFYANGQRVLAIGYSTGALDALLFALTFPDRCAGVVLYWPNFDIGVDPEDSYWALKPNMRSAYMLPSIGDRAQGSALALDPFLVRNPINAIARLVAMEGGPHLWILGDEDEAPSIPIPRPSRLAAALQAIPAAVPKTHVHITRSGDARRYMHGDGTPGEDAGISGESNTWGERLFMPTLLAGMSEWSFPRQTVPGGYRVFGWMKTREIAGSTDPRDDRPGFEIWLGSTSDPKGYLDATPRLSGGCQHAAEMEWDDAGGQFTLYPVTSQPGYAQVIRGAEMRSERFGDNQFECTADFTVQASEAGFQAIPETNTSLFSNLFAANSIPGLRVPQFNVPAGYEGGDALCPYVDRYGVSKTRTVYLAGKGGSIVNADFVCQELSVQLTSAGSNAGRAVDVRLRSALCTPDAPIHAVVGAWDNALAPNAKLTLTETNLTEGWVAVDGTQFSSTYHLLFAHGPLAQSTRVIVNLNAAPVLTTKEDLVLMGATHAWHSDSGGLIVGSPVSSWTDEIAGLALTSTSGKQPDPGTDGDGIQYIGFTAANEDRLGATFACDPNEDFTFVIVCTFPNNTTGTVLDLAHVVHNTGGNIRVTKSDSGGNVGIAVSAQIDGPAAGIDGDIGSTVTASSTVKRFVVVQRRGDQMIIGSQDASDSTGGMSWHAANVTGTFGSSNLRLTIGAWWANTIDDYYNWASTRYYAVLFFPKALSRAEVEGLRAYEKARMVF